MGSVESKTLLTKFALDESKRDAQSLRVVLYEAGFKVRDHLLPIAGEVSSLHKSDHSLEGKHDVFNLLKSRPDKLSDVEYPQ